MPSPKLQRIGCQVCLENFPNVGRLKSHIRGNEHHKQMAEVFPKGKCKKQGYFCNINVMEYLAKHQPERLIIGLSMVTVCTEMNLLIYLCHLCEESCTQDRIMDHLLSSAHLVNYFAYTDPDVLRFSWFPGPSIFQELKPEAIEVIKKEGNGVLQVLELPKDLFNVIRSLTYTSAMSTLEENEKLASQLKESKPKRISVQSYVADPSRKHALLGLQHLVEGVCEGGGGVKRVHLCTLCQITLRGHAIISHVISFDHVYRYINAWHPSTLRAKLCYKEYSALFRTSMERYARQAEERSGTNNSIKQLTVTTEAFNSLEASYSKALSTLETISRECDGRSLITTIQPGAPLGTVGKRAVMTDKGSSNLKEGPTKPSLKLRCQNCKTDNSLSKYTKHLNHWTHASEQRSIFGSAVEDEGQKGIPNLELINLIKRPSEEPITGLPYIVVCVCSKVKSAAGYLCFACLEYFSEAEAWKHMSSQRHALFTVLREKVPFAWDYEMDAVVLRKLAQGEQQANGDLILKVFDIPYCIFSTTKLTFYNLTKGGELRNVQYHLRNDVPWPAKQKTEHPLLGQDFVVKYSVMHGPNSKECRFLCLLCGRNLGRKESAAHVFSCEHAQNFLEKAHCGSLDGSDVSRETLLDLAKQAAEIHPVSEIQTILLDEPLLDSKDYLKAVEILQRVKWRQSNCELIPVLAAGKRLVPTAVLQETGRGPVKEETQAEGEKRTTESGQSAVNKRHSTSYTPPRCITPTPTGPNTAAETAGGPPGGATNEMQGTEGRASTATPETSSRGPVAAQPDTSMDLDSHPGKKIKEEPEPRDVVEAVPSVVAPGPPGTPVNVKQEPLSPVKLEPSDSGWQSPAASPKREPEADGGEAGGVQVRTDCSSTQTCSAECKEETAMLGKRKACGSGDPEVGSKRRRRRCPEDVPETTATAANPSGLVTGVEDGNATGKALLDELKPARAQLDKVLSSPPASPYKLWDYIKLKDREPVIGLYALSECQCEPNTPIYLCKCCCVKVHEKDIVGHVTGLRHRMRCLKSQSINVEEQQLAVRIAAAEQEQRAGFGEAQVFELTPEQYSEMSKQSYDFALLACQNTMQGSPPAPKVVTCKPAAVRPPAAQQPSPSLAPTPSSATTPLAYGTGETTHAAPQTKVEQPGNKAASLPTLESGTSVKGLDTDKKVKSTGTRKVFVPKIGIPAKIPVEKCIPATSIISVVPLLSLSRSQSRVTFATPLVTSAKLTPVSKVVSVLKSAKLLGSAASSKIEVQTGAKGRTNHDPQPLSEAKQPSLSVAFMPTSNTPSLASDSGKSTHIPPEPKAQKTGLPENKATSSPTLSSGAAVKVSCTDVNSQITVTSKSVVPEIGIPAKTPVEEFIPAPLFKLIATSRSISPPQSSVAVVKTPATSSKSIPSTFNNKLTTSSKGVNASKLVNPLRAVAPSKSAAPTMGRAPTNPDASVACRSTPIPHSFIFSHQQPAVAALPTARSLHSKPPGEQGTGSTEQGSGSASPTTPVYSPSTFPPNHTAVADSSRGKSLTKNQPIVGTGRLVLVQCVKRRQYYCLLCSARLKNAGHMTCRSHRNKYLEYHSFDTWNMDESSKLWMVTRMAEVEKEQGLVVKTVEVNAESYDHLATVPEEEALAKLTELLESRSHSSTKAQGPKGVPGSHAAARSADGSGQWVTQPDPARRGEPGPRGPAGRPTAQPDRRPPAHSKHSGGSRLRLAQKGEKKPSDLSTFLKVYSNTEPIIGLAVVFECRALFEETFYLCGSCMKRFPIKLICKHILKEYPQFMSWWDEDISPEEKEVLLRDISWKISETEFYDQMDAQVMMLRKDCYDSIRQAPFIQALDMLQSISREKKLKRLLGYQKPVGPQTPEAAATRESNAREKDALPQDSVDGEPTLPVVGIWAVVECSSEGQTPFYLCVVCGNRLSPDLVLAHVQGRRHVQEYLSARYPWADELGLEPGQLLGEQEEPSTMQRMALPQEDFRRIRTMTFDQALSSLQTICQNHRPPRTLTRVTSRPRPAVKRHFEVGRSDADKGERRQRLSGPPAADRVTQAPLKQAAGRSRLMDWEEHAVGGAGEPLRPLAHAPAGVHASKSATRHRLARSNSEPAHSDGPPAWTPSPLVGSMASLTRSQPVERADCFPVSCPHGLSGGNTPAATVPPLPVSLTHDPKEGPVPSAHQAFRTGHSPVTNQAAGMEMFLSDKDERNHDPDRSKACYPAYTEQCRREEAPKATVSYYPVHPPASSSVAAANGCSTGDLSGPVSGLGVIPGVWNTSNPHAETTAAADDSGARLPHGDLSRQGSLRQGQVHTGTNHNSRLQQIRNGQKQRLLQLLMESARASPMESSGPLAADLDATACSGQRSASAQSSSQAHNVTEETPGVPGSQGYSTGQPGYPPTPYHASGYVSYHHPPAMPSAAEPPLYPTHMNHRGGPLDQGLQQQLYVHVSPNQAQGVVMARGPPQYWPSVATATATSHGAPPPPPSYHGAVFASRAGGYSHLGMPSAFGNHAAVGDPAQRQGPPNPLNVQGVQTHYDCTSAAVMTSDPHGALAFHSSSSAGDGTS